MQSSCTEGEVLPVRLGDRDLPEAFLEVHSTEYLRVLKLPKRIFNSREWIYLSFATGIQLPEVCDETEASILLLDKHHWS